MNKAQLKREIRQHIQDIEDSFSEIENIVEDINDTELYETTIEWIDKAQHAILFGSSESFSQLEALE